MLHIIHRQEQWALHRHLDCRTICGDSAKKQYKKGPGKQWRAVAEAITNIPGALPGALALGYPSISGRIRQHPSMQGPWFVCVKLGGLVLVVVESRHVHQGAQQGNGRAGAAK